MSPITIPGVLNYDENKDLYWLGILGWVPKCVEELQKNPMGINDGVLYKYLYHTGDWGQEVKVYFQKVGEAGEK